MKMERLVELAGLDGSQLNEEDGYDVSEMKDTIDTLRVKLKGAGVDTSNMDDKMVWQYANKMKEITIESLSGKKDDKVVNERLMELAGVQLSEMGGYDVGNAKDTIDSLRAKLKDANVDTSNMTDKMVWQYANKMSDITVEAIINGGIIAEMEQGTHKAINWLDRSEIQNILEKYGFAVNDDESTDDLREALRDNIADGTISIGEIE